jgi:hypothetical protein
MNSRRFPPPWSIDELEACFVVIDGAGQNLAYVYFEDEPEPRSVRSGPHSRLSPIAFAADECKSLCELPLTREGCRDSRWGDAATVPSAGRHLH